MQIISTRNELLTRGDLVGQVFIGGEAAYVSLDLACPAFDGMVRQAVRPSSFKLLGEAGGLHVGIPRDFCDAMAGAGNKAKFCLLLDVYLQFMRRMKGDFLFIGGIENDYDTNLEFFLVKQGRIIRVLDKRLPRFMASDFSAQFMLALHDALDGQEEGLKIYWAYPMEIPEKIGSSYELIPVTKEQLSHKGAALRPVQLTENTSTLLSHLAFPIAGVLLGLGLAAAQVVYQYTSYKSTQADFLREVAPVEEVYSRGGAMLDILTKRQRILDEPLKQDRLIRHWKELAVASSETGGEIKRLSVFGGDVNASGLGGRSTNFEIDLQIPKQNDIPVRVFAKQILTQIANVSGYDMWLRPTEARSADGVMSVEIEGVWPDVQ